MRNFTVSKTREEVKRKLTELYSESVVSNKNVLDFDKGYDFFSNDEFQMIRYSSKWFNPDKYDSLVKHKKNRYGQEDAPSNQMFKFCYENGSYYRSFPKSEPVYKLEKLGCSVNQLARDLEKLGRTPYQIGVEGEKFRVVAATLQKCNSPFIRRTFQFTSNGIIETPELRDDGQIKKNLSIINQAKKGVTQKLVTIRRFRVIKKDAFTGDKSPMPQKLKIADKTPEKPRFLTLRIRSKERQSNEVWHSKKVDSDPAVPEVIRLTSSTEEEDFDYEKPSTPSPQAEETDDGEEMVTKPIDEGVQTVAPPERAQKEEEKQHPGDKKTDKEDADSNDTDEACFDYGENVTYQNCFNQMQRQSCQLCSKKFHTSKLLREHVRTQHPHQRCSRPGGGTEDRIKTATSKFGRTRRVLNIAGLRSKYKML